MTSADKFASETDAPRFPPHEETMNDTAEVRQKESQMSRSEGQHMTVGQEISTRSLADWLLGSSATAPESYEPF